MELHIIRHTTPDVAPGICYGQSDISLSDSFTREMQVIRTKTGLLEPDVVFCSPLQRCRLLAQSLFHKQTIRYRDELMEMNFGQWELKAWDAIPMAELQTWMDDFYGQVPPDGESFHNLSLRVNHFIDDLLHLPVSSKVAIVTHSGCMRVMLMKWLSIPPSHLFNLKLQYGAVIRVSMQGESTNIEFL